MRSVEGSTLELLIDVGEDDWRAYNTLSFLVPILGVDMNDTVRHVYILFTYDGGMVEFWEVGSGNFVGCAGIYTFKHGLTNGKIGIVDE